MVWAGAQMFKGAYGSRLGTASVLSIIYIGVVVSDMVSNTVTILHSSCWALQHVGHVHLVALPGHVGEASGCRSDSCGAPQPITATLEL